MLTNIGVAELQVLVGLALILLVLWLVFLIDALRRPEGEWQAAERSQLVFVLLMVFLGLLGTLLYVFIARPALRRIAG
jgi:heme/copper-type cytochrome/quinol oxidase subunit 4